MSCSSKKPTRSHQTQKLARSKSYRDNITSRSDEESQCDTFQESRGPACRRSKSYMSESRGQSSNRGCYNQTIVPSTSDDDWRSCIEARSHKPARRMSQHDSLTTHHTASLTRNSRQRHESLPRNNHRPPYSSLPRTVTAHSSLPREKRQHHYIIITKV